MEYTVHGTRNGTEFSAPVNADSEEEARELAQDDITGDVEVTEVNERLS